jgi:SAM-dependent methyltransferase
MPTSDSILPRRSPWWRVRRRILAVWIDRSLSETLLGWALKTDLFDEASGPHHHAADLPPRLRFLGIDQDPAVVRQARQRLKKGGTCVVADVRHLPFKAEVLPAVLSLSTLDHFENPADIAAGLEEISRVQRIGGRLLLTMDNPANPEVALRRILPAGLVQRLRADRFFIGATVGGREGRELLEHAGYRVEKTEYLIHAFRYPAIRTLAWLERIGWSGLLKAMERLVLALEILGRLPIGMITGHYVAWIATKVAETQVASDR